MQTTKPSNSDRRASKKQTNKMQKKPGNNKGSKKNDFQPERRNEKSL